ncbi:MAG: PAS domain S-box protein [Acidobacteria bacterium]|nr:PAS domain S-box protein [Acidobacteriota bacterium]
MHLLTADLFSRHLETIRANPAVQAFLAGLLLLLAAAVALAAIRTLRRRRETRSLRESEHSFREAWDKAVVGMFRSTPEGHYLRINAALARICGYETVEAFLEDHGEVGRKLYVDSGRPGEFRRILETEDAVILFESEIRRRDGSIAWISENARPVRDDKGKVRFYEGTVVDITERKQAEQRLRKSLEELKATQDEFKQSRSLHRVTLDAMEEWIHRVDTSLTILTANAPLRKVAGDLGLNPDLVGLKVMEAFPFLDRKVREEYRSVIETGQPVMDMDELVVKGRRFVIETKKIPVFDPDGTISGVVTVMMDLTHKREAEEELRVSRDLLHLALEASKDGIWDYDALTGKVYLSPRCFRMLGYDPDAPEHTADFWIGLIHPDDFDLHVRSKLGPTPSHIEDFEVEIRVMAATGSWKWLLNRGMTVARDERGNSIRLVGTLTDITDRKLLERALRITQVSVDMAAELILWMDPGGSLTYVNDTACETLGLMREELMARSLFDIDLELTPGQWPGLRDRVGESGVVVRETTFLKRGSEPLPVEVNLTLLRYETKELYCVFARDTSERKKAEDEQRKLEDQVRHAQKMESLGVLAGGIAHDFNNLLTGILGNAELALLELGGEEPARDYLVQIEKITRHASELTRQMLAYSGKGHFVVHSLNLTTLVQDMANLLAVSIPKKCNLHYGFAGDIPPIEADAAQLRQVVMNLILNAADAIGDQVGVIVVSTGRMFCDRSWLEACQFYAAAEPGEYAFLEVSDTGCGMDEETLQRIFDPFFTTKFTGRGLGLAAVLGIMRGHKGAIRIRTVHGEGTRFTVLFPAGRPARPEGAAEAEPAALRAPRSGRVLLVDDEDSIREFAARMLAAQGFEVVCASNGLEALKTFREGPDRFSLVLLDLTMPLMGGEETLREIRQTRTDVPVILFSGYSVQEASERLSQLGADGFLQKPFILRELLAAIDHATGRLSSGPGESTAH